MTRAAASARSSMKETPKKFRVKNIHCDAKLARAKNLGSLSGSGQRLGRSA